MNGINVISYFLLAFFVTGTFYVTYITANNVYNDCLRYIRILRRLLHLKSVMRKIRESCYSSFGYLWKTSF